MTQPERLRILCLDTTTQRMVIALTDGDVTHGVDEEGGPRASSRLLPAVQALMQQAGFALHALHAIAFARGPGAFTGLRTSASAAQGLAFGLDVPVLPIDSLLVVAEDARLHASVVVVHGARVAAAIDARMGEIYTATYRRDGDAWVTEQPPQLATPQALADMWRASPPTVAAGNALNVYADALALPANTPGISTMHDPAQALANLARQAWHAGQGVRAQDAQPVYVRDKVAFTAQEVQARRAAANEAQR